MWIRASLVTGECLSCESIYPLLVICYVKCYQMLNGSFTLIFIIFVGFTTNSIITSSVKSEILEYTQEILAYRLDNLPDQDAITSVFDYNVYENNILASYVL